MPNKVKINFCKLTDIEIYELVLQGRISSFPSGFWINDDTEKLKKTAIKLLQYLLTEKLKLNKEEIKSTVSKSFLTKYKLHTASKLFGRSAIKYVMSSYPGEYQPWQFKQDKVPRNFWTIEENRINALKHVIEVELNWSIEDIKEKLTWDIVHEKGLMTPHSYYPSLNKLVDAVYPNCIYPWEIINSEVPNGTWKNKKNRVLAIRWLLNKLDSDATKLDRKTFSEHGLSKLLGAYYYDNPQKAIKETLENNLYREIKFTKSNASICDI